MSAAPRIVTADIPVTGISGSTNPSVPTLADLTAATLPEVAAGSLVYVRSYSGTQSMGFWMRVETTSGHAMRTTSNGGAVEWTIAERHIYIEMCGAVGDFNYGTQSGTNNLNAINRAIAAQVELDRPIKAGKGKFLYNGNLVLDKIGARISGLGGYDEDGTHLVCGALSGRAMQVRNRSSSVTGIRLAATTARRNIGNPTTTAAASATAAGLLIGRDESGASASRVWLDDLLVIGHPGDGVVIASGMELKRQGQVTAQDNCRHGFVLTEGVDAGFSNTTLQSFSTAFTEWRALENGGHGYLCLSSISAPRHMTFSHFQALGNCWKRVHNRSADAAMPQVIAQGSDESWDHPDIEDQQYNQTVSVAGNTRTANPTPSGGIEFVGSQQRIKGAHLSSLLSGVVFSGNSSGSEAKQLTTVPGTYGTVAPIAVDIRGSAGNSSILVDLDTYLVNSPEKIKSLGQRHRIYIDGTPYIALDVTTGNLAMVRYDLPPLPQQIVSGALRLPVANRINIIPRFALPWVETISIMQFATGLEHTVIEMVTEAGRTISINDSGVSAASDVGSQNRGFTLTVSPRVISSESPLIVQYDPVSRRYVELAYDVTLEEYNRPGSVAGVSGVQIQPVSRTTITKNASVVAVAISSLDYGALYLVWAVIDDDAGDMSARGKRVAAHVTRQSNTDADVQIISGGSFLDVRDTGSNITIHNLDDPDHTVNYCVCKV